jgi:methyl-accepting chemotaxis protein
MMAAISVVGITAVALVSLSALRANLLEDRKAKVRDAVLLARQAIDLSFQASKKAGLSDAESLENAQTVARMLRFGNGDYFYAFSPQGEVQAHLNPKVEGKNLYNSQDSDGVFFARQQIEAAVRGGGFVSYRFPRSEGSDPLPKISYAVDFPPLNWVIGGGLYLDDIDTIFRSQAESVGAIVGIMLALVAMLSWLLARSIVNPIAGITLAMRKIAAGETDIDIPARKRRDEVGVMAQSVQIFKDNIIETIGLREKQDELKSQVESEKRSFLARMADDFEGSVLSSLDDLDSASVELRATSNKMSSVAADASRQSIAAAAIAEEASTNVEAVAAAAKELSTSVSEIGCQVLNSTQIANRAVEEAIRTNATVKDLSVAAQRIGDVIKLINEIASQTNLLALNATIEAARAGEAGRGFAVVASEVKSLASQTAKATEDISAQVVGMQKATTEAVQAIENIGSTIGGINKITVAIASAIEQQGSATNAITRNVEEAAHGTSAVSTNIGAVSQSAGQTGAAAGYVLDSAEKLNKQASTLRKKVDVFLTGIRAA